MTTCTARATVTDTATDTGTGNCPRCGGAFHCGVSDLAPCACTGLQLSAETLAGLRQRYDGCLCPACLVQLASPGAVTSFGPAESCPTPDQAYDRLHGA